MFPYKGAQNQKWLPLWGPKEGGNFTSPLCSSGVPNIRGTKSEVAASPLPSRGPKRGRKCYVTPTVSGVPEKEFNSGPRRAPRKNRIVGELKGLTKTNWS